MLKALLDQNKAFKLVTGAGNENLDEIDKLVSIYAQAGCKFFDICADIDVLKTAKNAIKKLDKNPKDFAFCVSIGIKDDPHTQKAQIDKQICTNCLKCISYCYQNAIDKELNIIEKNCIGCHKCSKVCPSNAISFYNKQKDLNAILPELINEGINCIELHANSFKEDEVFEKWEYLNKNFDGILSICLDRSNLSTENFHKRIEKALSYRKPFTTIIQADGNPMSGTDNEYKTTLEAIATAKIVQNKNYPAYLLISGGTNAKTKELASICNVTANGIAFGSYARMIVRNANIDDAVKEANILFF